MLKCCCCYHKGRNFQANHNNNFQRLKVVTVVVATTKVGIFKQITTRKVLYRWLVLLLLLPQRQEFSSKSQLRGNQAVSDRCCCCYHKGRNFQANHNRVPPRNFAAFVVVATTKVGIFKQITTKMQYEYQQAQLLLLPQRQEFSSKSQPCNFISW